MTGCSADPGPTTKVVRLWSTFRLTQAVVVLGQLARDVSANGMSPGAALLKDAANET